MFKQINQFAKNHWLSILISCFLFSLVLAYYGTDITFKLLGAPIISFFLVLLFHLEYERKNIKFLSLIQVLIGMVLGLVIQIKRENFLFIEGILFGGLLGLITPVWVKLFLFLKKKIGDYV